MAFFSRERPNGLSLVAFQISGSISGRPMRWAWRVAVHWPCTRSSTITASSVYRLTRCGTQRPLNCSSGTVSMMASPQSMRPFSPFHKAAAVAGLWNRMRQPMASSAYSVANTQPYFSSSRQALLYSAISRLSATSWVRASVFLPTKPSNMLRAASTSTVFWPQLQPTSSFLMPPGSAMPMFTSFRVMCPS